MTEITDAMVEAYLATSNAVVKAETSKLPLGSHILDDAVMAPIYRAACKAGIAAALAAQWQPIESAKKNGTWMRLKGGETSEDCYIEHQPFEKQPPEVIAYWDEDNRAWIVTPNEFSRPAVIYYAPTHFMPLPAPPMKGE